MHEFRAFEIGLGEHNAIGDRDLLARLRMTDKLREPMHGIERRHDRTPLELVAQRRIGRRA